MCQWVCLTSWNIMEYPWTWQYTCTVLCCTVTDGREKREGKKENKTTVVLHCNWGKIKREEKKKITVVLHCNRGKRKRKPQSVRCLEKTVAFFFLSLSEALTLFPTCRQSARPPNWLWRRSPRQRRRTSQQPRAFCGLVNSSSNPGPVTTSSPLREVDTERSSPSDKTKSPFAWYVNRTRVGEKQMEKKEKFYKETKNYGPGIPGLVARVCRCGLCSPTLEKRPFKTMTRSRSTENTTDRASVCKTFSFQNLQLLSRTYYALAKSVLSVSHVLGVGFNLLNPKTD